jgi:hypothetical protein
MIFSVFEEIEKLIPELNARFEKIQTLGSPVRC